MPRIAGVDIPLNKRVEVGLTYIYGIGRATSNVILDKAGIDVNKKSGDLDDQEVTKLRTIIEGEYTVEGDLRKEVQLNIKRLIEIGCYRGHQAQDGTSGKGTEKPNRTREREKGRRGTAIAKKKKSRQIRRVFPNEQEIH